jgi:hypothetical protein
LISTDQKILFVMQKKGYLVSERKPGFFVQIKPPACRAYGPESPLSFSHEARLTKPDWLVEKMAETVTRQFEAYVQKE